MIVLTLPYPISANRYWGTRVIRTGGIQRAMTYVTKEAEDFKAQVHATCIAHGITHPLAGRIALAIRLFPVRPLDWAKRAKKLGAEWDDDVCCIDLDNANKVLLDALKGVAFDDDKWVRRLQAERMEPDEHGARVIVAISQIPRVVVQGRLIPEEIVAAV